MNSPTWRWLLDVDRIPADAQNVQLAWERQWPAWAWLVFVLIAAALAVWSYRRLAGRTFGRAMLGVVRALVFLILIALLAGPMLDLPRERIEPDWLLMLVDRSASLTVRDAPLDPALPSAGSRITREAQLRAMLEEHDQLWRELEDNRELVWLGFHAGAFALESNLDDEPGDTKGRAAAANDDGGDDAALDANDALLPVELSTPAGQRTRIAAAIEQALQRAAARQISGIVLFSDGRSEEAPDRNLIRRLQAEQIPVMVVPLGSPDPIGDLAVQRVDAPGRAFVRDKVPVVVELDELGSAARNQPVRIRLIDAQTNEELDSIEIAPGEALEEVTLTAIPQLAGETTWQVVIDSPDEDLIPENNLKVFPIALIDRPLRVLYIDGYPRWEYRYLKNLLIREESIASSVMLLSADRDFAQEGNQPITRLPRTAEEFADFDVIIIGDVPATFFSGEQLDLMRDHVARRGAGMLWIGGERNTPQSFAGYVLSDLLPMRGGLDLQRLSEPVNMQPTDLAERLGVLQLSMGSETGWPAALDDPTYGWSQLRYVQRIDVDRLKPTAEVLAETVQTFDGLNLPLVVLMRFGAGQAIYVATDEIWRWRYGRGELLNEQFWVQLIRMLGRESLTTAGQEVALTASPRRLAVEELLRIDLQIFDAELAGANRTSIRATVERVDSGESDDHDARPIEIDLQPMEGETVRFATTFVPATSGELRIRINDPTLPGIHPEAIVDVYAPDDELRQPQTNHALLASLAEATGGSVLLANDLAALKDLKNRAVITSTSLTEPIWDSPLAFILILLLLTGEWIGRKMLRLV